MVKVKFQYRDDYSRGEWRQQECVVNSVEECKKLYRLGIALRRILRVEIEDQLYVSVRGVHLGVLRQLASISPFQQYEHVTHRYTRLERRHRLRHLNGLAEQRCIHRLVVGRYLVERCQQFLFRHLSVAATSLQYLLQTRGIEHRLVLQRRKSVVQNIIDDVKAVAVDGWRVKPVQFSGVNRLVAAHRWCILFPENVVPTVVRFLRQARPEV